MTRATSTELRSEPTPAELRDMAHVVGRAFSDELELAYQYVDRLCLELCLSLADELALLSHESESLERLMGRVGAVDEARYLVHAALDILTETGFARRTDAGWKRCGQWPLERNRGTHERACQACPAASPTFELIERCRAAAAGFVTGRTRGLAAIFPRGDLTPWERLHSEDRVMSVYADLAASALEAVVRPGMRVLEVGGGVGSVLARCASPLEAAGIGEYWFTDVGRTFVDAARDRHKDTPWLRFAQLDLDRPLEQQGFISRSLDVVVGVNVAHVARDLGYSLRELRGLLRPGGWVILCEGSPPNKHDRWRLDIVFAFLRGWWDVAVDSLRPRPGFLLPSEWGRALRACGYDPVSLLPGEGWFAGSCRGGLILAGTPGSRAECVRPMEDGRRWPISF